MQCQKGLDTHNELYASIYDVSPCSKDIFMNSPSEASARLGRSCKARNNICSKAINSHVGFTKYCVE